MLRAMGVCLRSSAALAAPYQLVRSTKIEQTSPGFAGSELLQALNTISAHQQALRILRDKLSELSLEMQSRHLSTRPLSPGLGI